MGDRGIEISLPGTCDMAVPARVTPHIMAPSEALNSIAVLGDLRGWAVVASGPARPVTRPMGG